MEVNVVTMLIERLKLWANETNSSDQFPTVEVQPQELMQITINTPDNRLVEAEFPLEVLGLQIKNYIYAQISQTIPVSQMTLYYPDGDQISNDQSLLVTYRISDKPFIISQCGGIFIDYERQDPYSFEKGVVKMTCGHYIGQASMRYKIRALVQNQKYDIRCDYCDQQTGNKCNAAWNFKDCKRTGFLNKQETQQLEASLSQNWIKKNCKTCPQCQNRIFKFNLKSNRVACPHCEQSDLCYVCLNQWKGYNTCGNQECKILKNLVQNAAWNRQFKLQDVQDHYKLRKYMTPQYRACPHCSEVIQHAQRCKHMSCKTCKKDFCWVCLSVQDNNGDWPCGDFDQYCGRIAEAQKFTNQ